MSNDDKRDNKRLSIDIPVKIRYNGITIPGKSANLSCGGIYVKAPVALTPDQDFDLVLHLPDGDQPLEVTSEVVWQESLEQPELLLEEDEHLQLESFVGEESGAEDPILYEAPAEEYVEVEGEEDGDVAFEDSGAGLRFKSLEANDKERIDAFIKRQTRDDLH